MKYYLVDDDLSVVGILTMILRDSGLGEVCGAAANGAEALEDLPEASPDVVIVDLLMPEMDGIEFVRQAKEKYPGIAFIMLSHVTSKEMIAQAYECGVEFFIHKPVHSVEVINVLGHVSHTLNMNRTFEQVHQLLGIKQSANHTTSQPRKENRIAVALNRLGISGDPVSQEIIRIAEYLAGQLASESQPSVSALCSRFSDSPKSLEQRIRRAVVAGMVNLANLGIEDYSNEIFTEYASRLYNFEQVRREMDFIRGKSSERGKVSLKKFLYALANICAD